MRLIVVMLVLLSALGCASLVEEAEPRNCETRLAFYPDADADGVGDEGTVYFGCVAPPGWVTVPPDTDAAVDTDTVDTDPPDTDPGDTDPPDTDPGDTDPADTEAADTDTDTPGSP
jgi:hypothetical protein